MSLYYTDTVDIYYVSEDLETGEITRTPVLNVNARVERNSGLIKNIYGKEERANYTVFVENTTVNIGDFVKIKSILGVSVINPREFEVKQSFLAGGFKYQQTELVV